MKPVHLLMAAALVGVGVLAYLLTQSDEGGRQGKRSRAESVRETERVETRETPVESVKLAEGTEHLRISVVMPDGTGAHGATLRIRDPLGDIVTAQADEEGFLTLGGVAPGNYSVQARLDRLVGAANFVLDSSSLMHVVELRDALTVRGTVFDAQGAPIAGATVEAVRGSASLNRFDFTAIFRRIGEPDDTVSTAKSDERGQYVLYLPGAGSYGIRASSDRHGQEHEPARDIAADTTGVDFHLFAAAFVDGRVVDQDGRPVPGAHVFLANMMAVFGGGAPKVEAIANRQGEFRLASPAMQGGGEVGGLILSARAPGYAARINPRVSVPSSGVEMVLERGAVLKMRTMDAAMAGRPVAGVKVSVVYGRGFAQGRSDRDGYVVVEHLPTQTHARRSREKMAILTSDEYVTRVIDLNKHEIRDGVLDLGTVMMDRGGIIRGVVRNKLTNDPVPGATVQTMGGLPDQMAIMGGAVVRSDEQGEFELRGVPLKASAIIGNHPDYIFDMRSNPMVIRGMRGAVPNEPLFPEGKTEISKDVLLAPGSTLHGTVTGGDGEPVEGAKVTVQMQGEMRFMAMFAGGPPTTFSRADGTFSLGPLEPGKQVFLIATHNDHGPSKPWQGDPAGTASLVLSAPLEIVGLVHDDAGKPVKGVRVTLSNPMRMGPRGLGEGMPRPGITDDQGRFVLRNAPRGKRTIECFHPHFLRKADQVQIGEEPRHDAGTIVLERGMKITGVVVDTDGQPVVDAQVTASKRQRDRTGVQRAFGGLNDQTDAAGKFGFYGLEPGEYRLSVSKDGFFVDPAVVAAGTEGHRIAVVAAGELKGFVRAEGKPVAEARISARIEGGSNAWATTGSDGRFTLGQLPPGKPFQLTIRHDRYRNLVREGVVATASEQAFDLEVGRVVEGIVVDENGRPVDGAQIQVHPGWRRASTGKDGRFQVSGFDEVELTVQLTESGRGYIQGEEVKLPVGENSVRLVAVVGKSIKGKVVGPDGKPASLVSIQAIDERGKSVANTWVGDLSGEFELRGVPPGTYTLRLTRWRNDGNDRTTHDVPGVVAGREDVTLEVPE